MVVLPAATPTIAGFRSLRLPASPRAFAGY